MKDGEVVEEGPAATLFAHPAHPYTRSLLDAVPGRHWIPPANPSEGEP
jgi:peptide/nickel transport system ATP-binding protein